MKRLLLGSLLGALVVFILLPVGVGAVAQPAALEGLKESLARVTALMIEGIRGILDLYREYLGAL